MKKITFKVSSPKEGSVVSLIKAVNKISCRIYFDLEDSYVTVENVSDTMIEAVIELIDKYYTILGINIDNTFEETPKNEAVAVVTDSTYDTTDDTVEKAIEELAEIVSEQRPTVLGPQSEDDLIIQKVEFRSKYIENRINSFLKTAYWALYNKSATEKEIDEYILTSMAEISMRYSQKPIIEFSIGDIVDVNYGAHIPGEIMGGHVHAIVCNMLHEEMAYVVPITKQKTDISSRSYLLIDAPQDVIYNNDNYTGGTVLVDKGKYVRVERFNYVVGKTNPEFFEKLLYKLASAFDFTEFLTGNDNNAPSIIEESTDEVVATSTETDDNSDQKIKTPTTTDNNASKVAKAKPTAKRIGTEEAALLEVIGFALDKLDTSKTVENQVESFLTDICMSTERMVTQCFIFACNIKRINYENVILELHKVFPSLTEEMIKNALKEAFKNWLKNYPTLTEKCPKISLISLLKVFAKKFA